MPAGAGIKVAINAGQPEMELIAILRPSSVLLKGLYCGAVRIPHKTVKLQTR